MTSLDLDELERAVAIRKTEGLWPEMVTAGDRIIAAAPELIRRARDADQDRAKKAELRKGWQDTLVRAEKAERELSRFTADMDAMERRHTESIEAVRKQADHAERERDQLRAIVVEVADDATVNTVHYEESSEMHSECSDCLAFGKGMNDVVKHDETCIVSRARAAIAKVTP